MTINDTSARSAPTGARRRRAWGLTAAVVATTLLAACSSSGGSGDGAGGDVSSSGAPPGTGSASAPVTSSGPSEAPFASLLPADIREKGKLSFASEFSYPPYEVKDADGAYDGGEVQILHALEPLLGVKFGYTNLAFASLVPAIGQGRFDVAGNQVGVSDERRKQVSYVTYGVTGMGLLVKTGNPTGISPADLCGRSITTETGTTVTLDQLKTLSAKCVSDGRSAIKIDIYATADAGRQAVETGRADANLAAVAGSEQTAEQSGGKLEALPDLVPGTAFTIGFIFAPKDEQLAKAFMAALQEIEKNGQLKAIVAKWPVVSSFKIEYLPATG